jgi:uncharacterized protein (TIGR03435 family)
MGLAISTVVSAQAFETASIKLSKPGDPRRPSMEFLPGGRFRSIHIPLLPVLATAYNVPFATREYLRIKNVPDWIFSEPYDIEAMPAAPGQRIRPMLRALFAERFKLKMRTEMVETAVDAIAIGPHGPKLDPSKIDERDCVESDQLNTGSGCHQILGGMGRGMHASAVTVADIALYASGWSDAPVVDQTGAHQIVRDSNRRLVDRTLRRSVAAEALGDFRADGLEAGEETSARRDVHDRARGAAVGKLRLRVARTLPISRIACSLRSFFSRSSCSAGRPPIPRYAVGRDDNGKHLGGRSLHGPDPIVLDRQGAAN